MARKSPSDGASLYDVGFIKIGNDGNRWKIVKTSNGVKRWQLIKTIIIDDGVDMSETELVQACKFFTTSEKIVLKKLLKTIKVINNTSFDGQKIKAALVGMKITVGNIRWEDDPYYNFRSKYPDDKNYIIFFFDFGVNYETQEITLYKYRGGLFGQAYHLFDKKHCKNIMEILENTLQGYYRWNGTRGQKIKIYDNPGCK